MIELNKMVSSDISNNIIFLKIKNDILKNLLGSYMIHNQITFLNSLLLKDYNYWVNSISFKKKKKNLIHRELKVHFFYSQMKFWFRISRKHFT